MAAREMGGLSLADALLLCELLANTDPSRYERAALRQLQRFIYERSPPLTGVSLAQLLPSFGTATETSWTSRRSRLASEGVITKTGRASWPAFFVA